VTEGGDAMENPDYDNRVIAGQRGEKSLPHGTEHTVFTFTVKSSFELTCSNFPAQQNFPNFIWYHLSTCKVGVHCEFSQ
jgi:hypothetical protein